MSIEPTTTDSALDHASRLFRFLAASQRLKNRPALLVDNQAESGHLLWLADLPDHPAVITAHRAAAPAADEPFLVLDRVEKSSPPVPGADVHRWLNSAVDNPDQIAELRDEIPNPDSGAGCLALDDHPEVAESYRDWARRWQAWAENELRDRPVRDLYTRVFATYVAATSHTENLELVIGAGLLSWQPPNHPTVRRHMLTTPVTLDFDDATGRLTVARVESRDPLTVELDMLDPGLQGNPQHINAVRDAARETTTHPLDRERVGELARRLVHTLDSAGTYRDDDTTPVASEQAVAAFAPALLLRKRSQQGLIQIFDTIVDQLGQAVEVPDGLRPLVDPDHRPTVEPESTEGAVVTVDDELFLPLPVNDTQLKIIKAVDRKAQILVQGPPGTGKTHTAAALLSHLLARGKRVLVTAHTDRALREVRDKLPDAIKPLSVAVVGSSREDMADLKTAVEYIASRASDHDPAEANQTVQNCLDRIEKLRRERARLYRELLDAREHETTAREHGGDTGTLAELARRHNNAADDHRWLTELITVTADDTAPLTDAEALEWLAHLTDPELLADETHSHARLTDLTEVPDPEAFADLVETEHAATTAERGYATMHHHAAYDPVRRIHPAGRKRLQHRLHQLADTTDALTRRREPWLHQALSDVRSGRTHTWRSRAQQLAGLIDRVTPLVTGLDPLIRIKTAGDTAPLIPLAQALIRHVADGRTLKTAPDGTPKIGLAAPRAVKQAEPLFTRVRVNGLPPTRLEQLAAFQTWHGATVVLDALDRAWPEGMAIPAEDTVHERLQWHVTELAQLRGVLALAAELDATENDLAELGLPRPDWTDLESVRVYARLVDAAAATDAATAAHRPLQQLEERLTAATRWSDSAHCVHVLLEATRSRDHDRYATAHRRLARLHGIRHRAARRDVLATRISERAEDLRAAVEADPHHETWPSRLGDLARAWQWAATGAWISTQTGADVNTLQRHLHTTDQHIREQVEILAATRAWNHAVAEERITGSAKANLQQYAQLVRRLGKGTGTYAAQRRAEIRQSMDRCRPAVPVWIMPIYRIAEQFSIKPDMFDVVIVDEASQAGAEATFLQYLAPKIVVIGDDKQVSPSAVGVNEQRLRDLANQYLADDPYKSTWQDPRHSFFDEAKMRYGGTITLTEHRRCVPEIIGFSNRIAYEPDGIRLIPVRQYGAERLDPVVPVFLPEGHTIGANRNVNKVEVESIVTQIEKCIADPHYDGKTFGVISLLGDAQARKLESTLLARLHPDEWKARDLRCGNAADFQGSERDVMFLSMVAAPEPGRSMGALTQDTYVQRYNVAVSRAKDQLWVFHSVKISDLRNKEDLRFQLLDYCYGVANRAESTLDGHTTVVPDDVLVPPFDSLFEQRVFNHLADRGYTVIPQYDAKPYRIDLVVIGPSARLAIECDGDHWHGPDVYERDLARQRDLERCGWTFFRIRESDFYIDRPAVLRDLWSALDALAIHPYGQRSEPLDTDPDGIERGEVKRDGLETPGAVSAAPVTTALDTVVRNTSAGITAEKESIVALRSRPTVVFSGDLGATDSGSVTTEPVWSESVDAETTAPAPTVASVAQESAVDMTITTRKSAEIRRTTRELPTYREFTGILPSLADATRSQLIDAIVAIVEAEGPVMGSRIHAAYRDAAGNRRVGHVIATKLNDAITAAVRKGLLAQENPLRRRGIETRTYRTPDQPEYLIRVLGPRSLDEIPPRELAAIITESARNYGWDDEENIYRDTLARLGKKRLTTNVRTALDAAKTLCQTWDER